MYRQTTLSNQKYHKLLPKFYGPYEVIGWIGEVAYRLALPAQARIHPVFHVSMLKDARGCGQGESETVPPEVLPEIPTPQTILERRVRRGREEVLVHWSDSSPADSSWEDRERLQMQFPEFGDADP
ncbi:hypothetical protein LINPERHAP2_LOCUS21088 [Linum perenne]